ncbi:MAG: M16 family metallopeptidase [Desulfobacterales bacterium]
MESAVHKTVLSNGVTIVTKDMPHVRSVSMGVWVNVGARDESPEENGLSHLIEHMIFKGTARRSAYQIAKEFDAIGGQTNAFTAMENTCYHARVMDRHLETMVDILSDIFLNSNFETNEIERERPVILQEIGMIEDSPEDFVHLLSGRNFWGDNPLGRSILGTPENIVRFDAEDIRGFFNRCYQPERIVISAAGNVDHERLVEMLRPAFESVAPGKGFPRRTAPETRSLIDVNHRQLEQVHICVSARGIATTDPRRYAFSLMNTIFGGNMSSRLFQEIREKRGLAYSVYSFISSYEDTGMFGAYVGVEPRNAQEATAVLIDELRRLGGEPIAEAELRDAKEYTKGSLLLAAESTDNQMVRLAQGEIYFGRHISLSEVIDQVDAVTPESILALAESLLAPNQLVVTTLGAVSERSIFEDVVGE